MHDEHFFKRAVYTVVDCLKKNARCASKWTVRCFFGDTLRRSVGLCCNAATATLSQETHAEVAAPAILTPIAARATNGVSVAFPDMTSVASYVKLDPLHPFSPGRQPAAGAAQRWGWPHRR
jgi:hypothetical protein